MPLQEAVALSLIESVYAAAENPALWPAFLRDYASAVRGTVTTFVFQDLQGGKASLAEAVNCDPEWALAYERYYGQKNVWILEGKEKLISGSILLSEQMAPDDRVRKSEFYADYLQPQDVMQQIGALIVHDTERIAGLTTMRSEHAEPFGPDEMRLAAILLPHLKRAVELHERLKALDAQRGSALAALDSAPYGVLLLGRDGSVISANAAAGRITTAGDGLSVWRGRLCGATPTESYRIETAVSGALAAAKGRGFSAGETLAIGRPSGASPYIVTITPLPGGGEDKWASSAPLVGVFIADAAHTACASETSLMRAYGLTRAEAGVARELAEGRTIYEVAAARSISRETVRTHVKRLFAKTQTSRQSELVRKLVIDSAVLPDGQNDA